MSPQKCADGANPDASCFEALQLSTYLGQWWTQNHNACGHRAFAACFYSLETKYAPSDCGQINNDAACTQPIWNDFKGTRQGIQRFYVAWNIWNTNGFFLDLYDSIGVAQGSTSAGLGELVALLDPVVKKDEQLNDVLMALTFGLSLYSEGTDLVKALLRSLPQTSGLTQKFLPTGTVDGQYQTWSLVSQNMGKVTDAYRRSIASGLPEVQNNITNFITWSEASGLSGFRPSLNGLVDSFTQALNTYAAARIIASLGFIVTRAANTDVHALQTNGSALAWNTNCDGGYDSSGVCDTYFFDGVDTYSIVQPDHMTRNFNKEMTTLFGGAVPMTTGKLLFTGAYQCLLATKQNGGAAPQLDPNDPTIFHCLSNLQVCTWDETSLGPFDSSCANLPARDAVLPMFGVEACPGNSENSIFDKPVPRGYLGPGVFEDAKGIDSLYADQFCNSGA